MGGANESTCPPVSGVSTPSRGKSTVKAASKATSNPVRYHEVTDRGEVDFHDDDAGVKCAIDSAVFFAAYSKWRPKMADELMLTGNDGSDGHASVTFMPYVDNAGEMQVGMVVAEAKMGQTILDLDILAHFP